jgi:hypothetical protein
MQVELFQHQILDEMVEQPHNTVIKTRIILVGIFVYYDEITVEEPRPGVLHVQRAELIEECDLVMVRLGPYTVVSHHC